MHSNTLKKPSSSLRIHFEEPRNEIEADLTRSLVFLLRQFGNGLGELKHHMPFLQSQGFSNSQEVHSGDVFQRALICDTLIDCNSWMQGQLQPLIEGEMDYLLSVRRSTGLGGWSYFPDLPELAPDADDLAQMILLFSRLGREQDLQNYCELPLEVLLRDQSHEDGSFETWIIPAKGRSPEQELQWEWSREAWGLGADNGVIANLLFALQVWDPERFRQEIEAGLQYLQSQQADDGAWWGTWYQGPFYGTYVCLRALTKAGASWEELVKGYQFLQDAALPLGGWGERRQMSSLQTSLSLLALSELYQVYPDKVDLALAQKGLTALRRQIGGDGGVESSPFIRMEMGRPSGFVHKVLHYGSRTLSTQFAIKALHQYHHLF